MMRDDSDARNAVTCARLLCGLAILLVMGCAEEQIIDDPEIQQVVGKWTIKCTPAAEDCPALKVNIRPDHTVKVAGNDQDGFWSVRADGTLEMTQFMVSLGGVSGNGTFSASLHQTVHGKHMKGTLERCTQGNPPQCDRRAAEAVR